MSLLLFLTKSTYRVLKATMKVVLWTRVRTGCEWKCPMPAFTLEISFLGHQEQPRAVQNYFLIVAVISTLWPGCDIFCFAIMALEKRFIGHYHSENSNSQSKNLMWRLLQTTKYVYSNYRLKVWKNIHHGPTGSTVCTTAWPSLYVTWPLGIFILTWKTLDFTSSGITVNSDL